MAIFEPFEEMSWSRSIAWRVVTRANLSAKPESEPEPRTRAIFGPSSPVSFAFFDRDTSYWKTSQATFLSGLDQFSETWPDSGTMRNGVVFERRTSGPPTFENGSSSWPTTRSSSGGGNRSGYPGASYRPALAQLTQTWRTPDAPGSGGPRNRQGSQGEGHQLTIAEQAEHWATPNSHDATGARGKGFELTDHHYKPHDLVSQQMENWATPDANTSSYSNGVMGPNIREQATQWFPTPQAADGKMVKANKRGPESNPSLTGFPTSHQAPQIQTGQESSQPGQTSRRRLNPRFVEWLMGFPVGWTEL